MIITCKECKANFKLDESLLKPTGSKVRCSKCNEIFVAYPPKISEEAETPIEIVSDVEDEQVTEGLEPGKEELPGPVEEKVPEREDVTDEAMDDLELDLDLDMASETEEAVGDLETKVEPEETDELDLSDLEALLDKEEEAESERVTDEATEDLNLEMTFEVDTSMEETTESDELEELDELDLSDLEEILDVDEPIAEEESVPEDIELELDLETEPELEHVPEGVEAESLEEEEVDLSEIEKMLEIEEETEAQEEPEEKALALELDMEEASVDTGLPEDSSQVEVFELDEADETMDKPEAVEVAETEEIKPEFEVEESVQEDQVEDEIADEEPVLEYVTAEKERRVSKPLVVLLILALLAGGAYGTYVVLDFMNIEIPYISDYFKPKVSDPDGNIKIDTLDINSKFILNVKEGKLFVITGRIKNGYSNIRSYININGKLYSKGKNLAQTETVFCGNVLSDIELSNMQLEAIKKRLSNRLGDNNSNMKIKPGGELPFMIVFSNLPDELEEFSIEVVGSTSE